MKQVTKLSTFKHLDRPEAFHKALQSRDKFYYYEQVSFIDMFFDIARRNHSEIDITKDYNIDKLAWFNLNSFMIRIEPPLDVLEQEIKNIFMNPIENLEKIQKLYFGTIEDKMNDAEHFKKENKHMYKQESNQKLINELSDNLQVFITDSFYSVYALLKVLLSFEFYVLYSKQYEKFLIAEIESNQIDKLEDVFNEMERLMRDMHVMKTILPDQFNLGVFLVDITEFKSAIINQIIQKDALIKKNLQISCIQTLKKNEDLEQLIHTQLDVKPQTIDQFIKINQYLQGDEIVEQINQISLYIALSHRLFEQLEIYQISLDQQNYTDFLQQDTMLRGIYILKEQKEKKQEENKPKFKKMHMDKKNSLLNDINILKKDIESFSNLRNLEDAYTNQNLAESLKSKLTSLDTKIKEIRYEEMHLNTGYDGRLDLDEYSQKFEYYNLFWKFASEWKYKKEIWLGKTVINNQLSHSDLKDIEQTLENGNKMIRQVEVYFQENDYEFSELVNFIQNEIQEYEQIYDFLVLVSHESFKQEHWNIILDTLYSDDPERKKWIMSPQNSSSITLQELLKDKILLIIVYIKSIAGQAENEFKVHESIKSLENELKKIGFSTINYFGIPMLQNTSEISSYLKLQQQIIGNMVKNKVVYFKLYSRNDFAHKLAELQQQVVNTKKVLKYIGLLQNLIIRIIPIINFSKYISYLKDGIKDFSKSKEQYEQVAKDLKQRGLLYLLELFMNKDYEHQGDKNRNNQNSSNNITGQSQNLNKDTTLSITPFAKNLLIQLEQSHKNLSNLENSIQSIIRYIRQQNSRFTFFSDFQILNLCESVYNTKEFSDTIRQAFLGIQSFHIVAVQTIKSGSEVSTPQMSPKYDGEANGFAQDEIIEQLEDHGDRMKGQNINSMFSNSQRNFQIQSLKNYYNEQISFSEPINYSLQQYEDPPTFTMIKDIENSSRAYIKQQILNQLYPMAKNSYNYQALWNIIQKKQSIFQVLYLINDIIFYHDLTIILEAKDIPYQQKLGELRQQINNNLKFFISGIHQGAKSYGIQKMNFLQSTQFFLQILHHIEILNEFCESKEQLVEGLGCYEYLILPKFTLEMSTKQMDNVLEVQKRVKDYSSQILQEQPPAEEERNEIEQVKEFPNLIINSPLISTFKGKNFDICLISMNYKKSYTYEINPQMRGYVITPGSRRIFHQLIQALSTNSGGVLKGPQATGKYSSFETLCILLAKPYFIWKFEHDQNYNTVQNILTGVAAGGLWLYIKSLETCDLGIISAMAQAVFLIRKSIMNEQRIFQFAGKSFPVHPSYGMVCGFTDKLNILDHKFTQLPKSLLENFRVINVIEPDLREIVNSYFILYGFQDRYQEYSIKFISFLRYISTSYENNHLMKNYSFDEKSITYFKESIMGEKFQIGNFLSLKTVLKILRLALAFQTEKQNEQTDTIQVIQACVSTYFTCLLGENEYNFVMKSFSLFFGTEDKESNNSEIFDRDYMSIQSDLLYYLQQNNLSNSNYVQKLTNNIFPLIVNKSTLIFSGRSGKNKSFFIKLLGYLYSKQKKKQFYLNWLKIDSISPERLLGCFNSKGEWEEGVVNQIITSMESNNIQKKLLNKIKYYGNKNFCSYSASQVTRDDSNIEKLKQQSLQQNHLATQAVSQFLSSKSHDYITEDDWIVIDSSSQANKYPHNLNLDRLLVGFYNRQFNLSNQDILKVPLEAFCVFEMESLDNMSPNHLANHILIHMSEEPFSLKEEFNAWLLRMKQKNIFFGKFDFAAKVCFSFFFEQLLETFEKMPESAFRYIISKKAHLNNFLNYFEIFINEIRKLEIASGEWEDENNKFNYSSPIFLLLQLNYFNEFVIFIPPQKDSIMNKNKIYHYTEELLQIYSDKIFFLNLINIISYEKGPNVPRTNLKKIKNQQQIIMTGDEALISEMLSSPSKLPKKSGFDKFRFSDSLTEEALNEANQNQGGFNKSQNMKIQKQDSVIDGAAENAASKQIDVKQIMRQESDVRLVSYLESIFIFSLTWSVGNILKNEQRNVFNQFLENSIEQYLDFRFQHTRVRFSKDNYPFAMNLRQLFETNISNKILNSQTMTQSTIFDLCFDIVRGEWMQWQQLSLEEFGVISGNLVSNNIDTKEIIRLNPYALDIIENKISKEVQNISLPDKTLFVETKSTKITKHFLQYFVAYQKPLLLISRSQNGLTTLVNQRTQALMEQFNYSPVFVSCTSNLSVKSFQKKIESNLISSQPFVLTSPNRTNGIVIVDDFNLASYFLKYIVLILIDDMFIYQEINKYLSFQLGISPVGAIRSFLEGNSWFSNSKNRFVQFQNIELLCLYSHSGQQSTNMFDQRYCNLPLSVIEKSMIFKMPNQDQQELISIFTEYNSLASSGQAILLNRNSEVVTENLSYQLFQSTTSLALTFVKHRFQLAEISCNFKVNLAIQKALEVVRNLNYFDFYDNRNSMSSDSYFKSLIFLLNQYYAQEFIHNSCEVEEKIDINQVNKFQEAQGSYAPSLTRAFSISDESNDRDDELGVINQPQTNNTFVDTSENYAVEFVKLGLVCNISDVEQLQQQFVEMSCFEKLYFFTNIMDGNDEKLNLTESENFSQMKQLNLGLTLQSSQSSHLNVPTTTNIALAIQKEVSIEMKTKMNQQNDDIISQSEIVEELYQKRAIQVWHTPSRHVSMAFKSTFMQKNSKFKAYEKSKQEETAYKIFLQKCIKRVEEMKINNDEIEILPEQLITNLIELMIGKKSEKASNQNQFQQISKRNEIMFFNEELYDDSYGASTNSKANLSGTINNLNQLNFKAKEAKEPKEENDEAQNDQNKIFSKLYQPKKSIELQVVGRSSIRNRNNTNEATPSMKSGEVARDQSQSNLSITNKILKDEQKQQFTYVGKKQQKKVVAFLIEQIKSYEDKELLLQLFSVKENTIYSLYYHQLKLMHLLQISNQSIILQSIISLDSAYQLLKFVSFNLKYTFTYFNPSDIQIDSLKSLKKVFRLKLENAINGIFTTELQSVLFINMSQLKQKDNSYQIYILETVNSITKGNEILTLFSRKKWEKLITTWKMHKKFIGLSNYILYYLISYRLTKKLKIVLYYEPQPTKYDSSMELISSYQKLMSQFTKYQLFTALDPQKRSKRSIHNSSQSITEMFKEFSLSIVDNFEEEKIRKIYYKDFELQKIYSKSMNNFKYQTYQQTKYDFFYTYHMIKTIYQEKIYKAENETILFQLKEICEKKVQKYEKEIQSAQQKLEQTIQLLETCQNNYNNALTLIADYETQISSKLFQIYGLTKF